MQRVIKVPEMNKMNEVLALAWVVHNEDLFKERVNELQAEELKIETKMAELVHKEKEMVKQVAEAQNKVKDILVKANVDANAIVNKAMDEADALRRKAKEDNDSLRTLNVTEIEAQRKQLEYERSVLRSDKEHYKDWEKELLETQADLAEKKKSLDWAIQKGREVQEMYENKLRNIMEAAKA